MVGEAWLTKREELSFLTVLALPNASRMGLACSSWASSSPCLSVSPVLLISEVLALRTSFFCVAGG